MHTPFLLSETHEDSDWDREWAWQWSDGWVSLSRASVMILLQGEGGG